MALVYVQNKTFVWNWSCSPHDTVELELRDLRTLESGGVEWITNDVLSRTLLKPLNELVVDLLLYIDTRSCAATLAVVEEDTEVDPGDGIVDIGIRKHNVRALATKLKRDLLQVGASSGLHDLAADNSGSGESNLVNVHVGGDGGTSDLTDTREDVDDAWRETSLLNELGCDEGRERGLFSGLENDNIASSDSGANLPCPHKEWEVPWNDLTAHSDLLS
jgi:hypothetical protein